RHVFKPRTAIDDALAAMRDVRYIGAMSQLSPEDRIAIAELMAAYCHAIDLGRWEDFPELFSTDCRLDFGSVMGVFGGTEGLRRFADTLRGIGIFMRLFTT